ncbi:hypothetical protein PLCT1_01758 [Planctomycetaceae bacterium]|nr:hypothetical protein PLCT1_01758 [Planctomycetaceae bacterium]
MFKRTVLGALGCALLLASASIALAGSPSETTPVGFNDKLPAPADLKLLDGEVEGRKSPLEAVKTAIKAAKDNKSAELKACFQKSVQEYLDGETYFKDKEMKEIDALAMILGTWNAEGKDMEQFAQNRVGKYGVVSVKAEKKMYLVRCRYEAKGWYLMDGYHHSYAHNWASKMDEAIASVKSGEAEKVKTLIAEHERPMFDLVAGEGCDPYGSLAKKLKGFQEGKGKPLMLLNAYSDVIAFWFHTDKEDKFITFQSYADGEDTSAVTLSIWALSEFNKDSANAYVPFVLDDEAYFQEEEEGGK